MARLLQRSLNARLPFLYPHVSKEQMEIDEGLASWPHFSLNGSFLSLFNWGQSVEMSLKTHSYSCFSRNTVLIVCLKEIRVLNPGRLISYCLSKEFFSDNVLCRRPFDFYPAYYQGTKTSIPHREKSVHACASIVIPPKKHHRPDCFHMRSPMNQVFKFWPQMMSVGRDGTWCSLTANTFGAIFREE